MAETGFGCKQNDQQLILAITKLIATLQHTKCHKGFKYHVLWKQKKRGQVVMEDFLKKVMFQLGRPRKERNMDFSEKNSNVAQNRETSALQKVRVVHVRKERCKVDKD